MKSNWRLHGEGFSPGANAARAKKSEKIPCNRNGISARAEKQETRYLPLRSRSDFSGMKAIK